MKLLCSKSGILFSTQYFPYTDNTGISCHPCFAIPQHKLLAMASKWAKREFTSADSYLYFLSLLNSTSLVEFRVPCKVTSSTESIIESNMEDMIQLIGRMNLITHPHMVFSSIAISPENNTLENVKYWIALWQSQIDDFASGYASLYAERDMQRREAALEKLIKSSYKESVLAASIASWAEIAGVFPTFSVTTQFGEMTCAEYWKLIIRKCINKESIFQIPPKDITEVIEHCETEIEHGSIYAHTLMSILRSGLEKNKSFLGLGDWDIESSSLSYLIVEGEDSVEVANFKLLESSAPSTEPRMTEYPSRFEYLKAKMKWELSQSQRKGN
jgi:hypothetical protein